jgi:signal transduction histidine kinase
MYYCTLSGYFHLYAGIDKGHHLPYWIKFRNIFNSANFSDHICLLYNRRKKKHAKEKEMLQKSYADELLKTQMEVQEQTLKTIAYNLHDNIGQLLALLLFTNNRSSTSVRYRHSVSQGRIMLF